jgi:hypothetical protein
VPVQSRGTKTAAASSAAVASPSALPVATASGGALSLCATCVGPRSLLPGTDASVDTIHFGITSIDAGYANSIVSAITPATITALRITPQ